MRLGRSRWWYGVGALVVAGCCVLGIWGSDGFADGTLRVGAVLLVFVVPCAAIAFASDRRG